MVGHINKNPIAQLLSYPNVTSGLLGGLQRALLFNTAGDPLKSGRGQIRMPHWNKSEMPDEKCPWVQQGLSAASQTASGTPCARPGQMVYAFKTDDQNWCIPQGLAIGNDNIGQNQSQPPASGPDMKDNHPTAQEWEQRQFSQGLTTSDVLFCDNSDLAERIRDQGTRVRGARDRHDNTVEQHQNFIKVRKPKRAYDDIMA